MPLGSSSDAPVTTPGPKMRNQRSGDFPLIGSAKIQRARRGCNLHSGRNVRKSALDRSRRIDHLPHFIEGHRLVNALRDLACRDAADRIRTAPFPAVIACSKIECTMARSLLSDAALALLEA